MIKKLIDASGIVKGFYTFFICIFNPQRLYQNPTITLLRPIPYAVFALSISLFLYFSIGNENRATWFDAMNNIEFQKVSLDKQNRLFGYLNISIAEWNRYINNTQTVDYFIQSLNRVETKLDVAVRSRHGTIYADEIAKKMMDDGYADVASYFMAGKAEADKINGYLQILYYIMFFIGVGAVVFGFIPVIGVHTAFSDVIWKTIYVNSTLAIVYGAVSIMEFFNAGATLVSAVLNVIQVIGVVLTVIHIRYVEGMTVLRMLIGFVLSFLIMVAFIICFIISIAYVAG